MSITALFFALEKQGIITHEEFLRLKREWNKYSKIEGIDVYGNIKEVGTSTKTLRNEYEI